MATVEKLHLLQDELLDNLKKSERNYRKTPKERIKKSYIETRIEVLERQYIEFKEGHKQIVSIASKEKKESYFTQDKYEEFEEVYVQYKTMLREALQLLAPSVTEQQSTKKTNADSETENNNNDIKLPRINLPTFSGKYEEWQTFFDMFSSLIHNNKSITSVQKLHYLKGNLTGEALNLLRNFSVTEANYKEAWEQLIERYDNKRYNCNAVLRSLFALKKLHIESANSIRHLLDTTSTCLKSLQNMGIDTISWDAIIVFLIVSKLDPESMKLWEHHLNTVTKDLPTWEQLRTYLENRFRTLEIVDTNTNTVRPSQPSKPKTFHMSIESKPKMSEIKCAICHENHFIYHCKRFELMEPKNRQDFVQNNRLCFNCLSPTHAVMKCRKQLSCRKCGKRHHTLLHFEREFDRQANQVTSEVPSISQTSQPIERASTSHPGDTNISTMFSRGDMKPNSVLLATARVKVLNVSGCQLVIRALLDQGSQASFITEATAQLLGIRRKPVSGWVSGLGDGRMRIKHTVSFCVESRHNPEHSIHVNAYVLHSLTSLLPATKLTVSKWQEIEHLPLADPTYSTPGKIDILLGADVYGDILLDGVIKQSSEGSLIAQNSIFGWILSGKAVRESEQYEKPNFMSLHVEIKEDELLKKFWEIEDEPNMIKKEMSKSEKFCEDFFDSTSTRDEHGRFVVRLPFSNEDPKCQYGQSRKIAVRRLLILERKLLREPKLREEYNKVMDEYYSLNHMKRVEKNDVENPKAVYLPHHAVVREDRETTKVRVVFDASSKGENNVSLNDELLVGPKLQQDLRHILMRWRRHKVCLIADIVKMYRMIRVADQDTDYQRIVWRSTSDGTEPIQDYKLLRLTFGTASAPYLAVKSLQKLAELEEDKYPLAAKITKEDFYVDDCISGAVSDEEALKIYLEMNELMNSGGFQLQKWNSNSKELLQKIGVNNESDLDTSSVKFNKCIKVLGVSWNRETDNFEYVLNLSEHTEKVTKRQVLADVARLYDPLGWIAPVVVIAKILIQKLWKSGLQWDDYLTETLLKEWLTYRRELVDLKKLILPRWMGVTPQSKAELHVFSDASKLAYSAVVYIRVIDETEQIHVHLVTAKTKVAPIDKEVTIPRLELCGAALAAKLVFEVSQVLNIDRDNLHGWTDSTIVLAWLTGGPTRWSTFVSNRVSSILKVLNVEQWNHISSEFNPADCASRGLQPNQLLTHPLWWSGPNWLAEPIIEKDTEEVEDTNEEERIKSLTVVANEDSDFIWSRFSSLTRLLRVLSYCRRFLNLKLPKHERPELPNFITSSEIKQTLLICTKLMQESEFTTELKQLKNQRCVPKKSKLRTLKLGILLLLKKTTFLPLSGY